MGNITRVGELEVDVRKSAGLYQIIAPITVGNIVGALDPSPQGLLQLVAFFSSKLAQGLARPSSPHRPQSHVISIG